MSIYLVPVSFVVGGDLSFSSIHSTEEEEEAVNSKEFYPRMTLKDTVGTTTLGRKIHGNR